MLDLTTLEKTGAFPDLEIHALKDKIGLHLIVLYIVIGNQRFPWSLLIWRGKGSNSPTQLGLRLLQRIEQHGRNALTFAFSQIQGLTSGYMGSLTAAPSLMA